MAYLIAFNRTRGNTLARRVIKADTPATRGKGLLGRTEMSPDEGLWIVPCSMIHMFGMRFAIDVVFLDRGLRVKWVIEGLKPWRLSPWVLGAHSVLELAGGSLRGGAAPGDLLEFGSSDG